jgi:hypothetical protein
MAFDVSVVLPRNSRSSEAAANRKNIMYRQRCNDKGIGFVPLIFEAFGKLYGGIVNLVQEACLFSANKLGGDRSVVSSRAAVLSRY